MKLNRGANLAANLANLAVRGANPTTPNANLVANPTPNPAENPSANLGANLAAKPAANPTANPTTRFAPTRAGFAFLGLIVALLIIALLGGAGAFYFNKTAKDAKKTTNQITQAQIKKEKVLNDIVAPTPEPAPQPTPQPNPQPTPPVIVPPAPTPPTEPPIVSVYRYGRTLLNDNEKAAYDEILSQALRYEGTLDVTNVSPRLRVKLKANVNFNTLLKIANYLSADCPECFHVAMFSPSYDHTIDARGFVREYGVRLLAGYDTKEKYFAKMNQILATTQPIFEKMNAATSQIDKIKIAHDELLKVVRYAGASNANAGDISGAFLVGNIVCEGYSRALLFLLQRGGFNDVLYTTGYGNGGPHAWNAVSHNGTWYFIDSTWDDGQGNADVFHHDNFMKGTDDFYKLHNYTNDKGETYVSYPQMPTMSKTSLKGNWN